MEELSQKKVVLVVAFHNFRDEEYFIPRKILEESGIKVFCASTKKGVAVGADGGEAIIDILLGEINPKEYDGVVFIGGAGSLQYLDNPDSYRLIMEIREANRILGAICIAPVILAKAGVLKGIKATVWSSPLDKFAIKALLEYGAEYVAAPVVIDGKTISADGPSSAEEFGQKLVRLVQKG